MKNLSGIIFILLCASFSIQAQVIAEEAPLLSFLETHEQTEFSDEDIINPFRKNEAVAIARNGEEWILDSIYTYRGEENDWSFSYRYKVLTRDTCNNRLTDISETVIDGILTNTFSKSYTYYDSSSLSSIVIDTWDDVLNQWRYRSLTEYNIAGNRTFDETYHYDFDNDEVTLAYKTVYEYEADELLIYRESYVLDSLNEWELFSNQTYTYYDNDLLESHLYYDSKVGAPRDSSYYQYNDDDLVSTRYDFSWDTTMNNWRPKYRTNYSYNQEEQISLIYREHWSGISNTWIDSRRITYTYYPDEMYYTEEREYNNIIDPGWTKSYFREYYFNTNGALEAFYTFNWNDDINNWENQFENLIIYDDYGNALQRIYNDWNTDLGIWEKNSRSDYYYSQPNETTSIDETIKPDISITPNPSKGYFSIRFDPVGELPEYFQVFNMLGNKITEQRVSNHEVRIDLSVVPAGMYYLVIASGESFRLVKQ